MDNAFLEDVFRRLEVVAAPQQSVMQNLALDEALLRVAVAESRSFLRLWWGDRPTVVLGRSEEPDRALDLKACRRLGVQVVRRPTGGGAVLQDEGVLNYSLAAPAPGVLDPQAVFRIGTAMVVGALARLRVAGQQRGVSDIAVGDRKISGSAQAWRKGALLLHGTLLYHLDVDVIEACLRHPAREPEYRRGRSHRDFLTSLREQGVDGSLQEAESALLASALALTSGLSRHGARNSPLCASSLTSCSSGVYRTHECAKMEPQKRYARASTDGEGAFRRDQGQDAQVAAG